MTQKETADTEEALADIDKVWDCLFVTLIMKKRIMGMI